MNIKKRSGSFCEKLSRESLWKHLTTCMILGSLCSLSTAQAVDPLTYFSGRHRIRPACNVPPGDYQYMPRTPAVSSGSLPALPRHSPESMERAIQAARNPGVPQVPPQLGVYPNAMPQFEFQKNPALATSNTAALVSPDAKTLQMAAPFLEVAHCRIRDASIAIDPKGHWTISFKAEQNPLLDRDAVVRNIDLQLKRNLFVMDVRLTDAAVSRTSAVLSASRTLPTIENHRSTGLVQLQVPRISIQRESSEFYTFQGNDPKIAQHFDFIAGAEFQFYALLDPLTGSGQGVVMPWQHPSWKK